VEGNDVALKMGSLFAGDERRAFVELSANLDPDDVLKIDSDASWRRVGASDADVRPAPLTLASSRDANEIQRGKDGTVVASWTSVTSSQRELEATQAYASGDKAKADGLIQQNLDALSSQLSTATDAVSAESLKRQIAAYGAHKRAFAVPPASDDGKRAAKTAAAKETSNLGRAAY
jgi:hypothetical protein